MNKIINAVFNNPHTSWSAIALFAATVAGILWPKIKPQADEIARAAIVYGLIRAGDAGAAAPGPAVIVPPTTTTTAPSPEPPKP